MRINWSMLAYVVMVAFSFWVGFVIDDYIDDNLYIEAESGGEPCPPCTLDDCQVFNDGSTAALMVCAGDHNECKAALGSARAQAVEFENWFKAAETELENCQFGERF